MTKKDIKARNKAKEMYFNFLNPGKGLISNFLAKQMAMVAVDEILSLLRGWPEPRDTTIVLEIDFYERVKFHLKSL